MSLIPDHGGELEGMRRRKSESTAKGGKAFLRLLSLAEAGDSGQHHTVARFIASTYKGQDFPQDPYKQLEMATRAVFNSWFGKRAIDYRNATNISHDLGTAVNLQGPGLPVRPL